MIDQFFNSTLEVGSFLHTTTSNFTGSDYITFLIIAFLLFAVAMLFHMPELLFALVVAPLFVVFGLADPSFTAVTEVLFIAVGVILGVRMIFFR